MTKRNVVGKSGSERDELHDKGYKVWLEVLIDDQC